MIYLERPNGFQPKFEAVGCFFEVGRDILLLLRHQSSEIEPGKWGMPAGKIKIGETKEEAMAREFWEETGNRFHSNSFNFLSTVFVEYPQINFVYHIFRRTMRFRPSIILNQGEHEAFLWTTPFCALKRYALMQDEDFCIRLAYEL